jgi:hypothetical protein
MMTDDSDARSEAIKELLNSITEQFIWKDSEDYVIRDCRELLARFPDLTLSVKDLLDAYKDKVRETFL